MFDLLRCQSHLWSERGNAGSAGGRGRDTFPTQVQFACQIFVIITKRIFLFSVSCSDVFALYIIHIKIS